MVISILAFVVVLGLLVFVHELGHFLTAKKAGCQVDEFGFGFPPRLFGVKRGETIYSLNWIPLGGFVKIAGEDGEEGAAQNPRNFSVKPVWQRLVILAAGVGMNLLLAVVLLSIGFMIGFPTEVADTDVAARDVKLQIVAVSSGSPAESAGLKLGDEIRVIAETPVSTVQGVQDQVAAHKGEEITIKVLRDGAEREIRVTPRVNPPAGDGPLGISPVRVGLVKYGVGGAIVQGARATWITTQAIVGSFVGIIRDLFATGRVKAELSGPVGIAVLTGQAVHLGFVYVLQFAALLSINLAIINLFPFPGLDGGRALFVVIELIRGGKKLDKTAEGWVHQIGFFLLLGLMVLVTVRDVARFFMN